MSSLSMELDQGLLQELECPVCMEIMKPPIMMCENGHNICPNCKPKLNNCPTCTKPFLQIRNLALESLSRQVGDKNLKCQSSKGPEILKCPFASLSKEECCWSGPITGLKDHVKNVHNNGNDTHEAHGVFNVILTGLAPKQHYRKAVLTLDKLFYLYWEIRDGNFYCCVLCGDVQQNASKYTYKFVISSDTGEKKVSMSFPTLSILENIEEVLQSGDCVILNYNTVVKFLNTSSFLECEFEISAFESDINDTETCSEVSVGVDVGQQYSSRHESRRHRRGRRYDMEHKFGVSDVPSYIKPGRCVHGKRSRHCRLCKYSKYVQNAQSASVPETVSVPVPEFHCAPSGQVLRNDTEKQEHVSKLYPSAPFEKEFIQDPNIHFAQTPINENNAYGQKTYHSTASSLASNLPTSQKDSNLLSGTSWKCQLCGQSAPAVPTSQPGLGWHTSTAPTGSKWTCKMCGQIRQ
ncbi:uncharacterized protein [Periplaneta americana]|uniref:uncharacterized protein n=1 Tax=Periplaneta americana TaxID=6978 RepID=UPI0037E9141A